MPKLYDTLEAWTGKESNMNGERSVRAWPVPPAFTEHPLGSGEENTYELTL